MSDDPRVVDSGWDALSEYKPGDADEAVTVSISTTPGEWLVNTVDAVVVPMSMAEVVEALRMRKLTERSLVWRAGMQEWAPVERVPQLKLAARLPSVMPSTAPAPTAVPNAVASSQAPPRRTNPPAKPARPSSPQASTPVAPTISVPPHAVATPLPPPPRVSAPAAAIPSRRATLPGFSSPLLGQKSRPSNPLPSSPRQAVPPPASSDDADALAVYARPAATISFDLPSDQPLDARTAAVAAALPQTLAPTTTDSGQRRPPGTPAPDFTAATMPGLAPANNNSRRLILISSVVSAAAASLLTLWLSRGGHSASHAAAPLTAPTVSAVAAVAPAPTPPAVAPAKVEVTAPVAAEAETPAPAPKSKSKHRARAVAPRAPRPAAEDAPATTKPPVADDNPSDVKLEEDAPKPAVNHGSGLEAEPSTEEPKSASNPASPGF